MKEEYLSHYTNVDTLEIILETMTIKLNKLEFMNDSNEGRNIEGFKTEKILYSSSWSEDKSECGIGEMWEKYTTKGCGIRITTERYPFKKYDVKGDNIINDSGIRLRTYLNPKKYKYYIDSTQLRHISSDYKMLRRIEYTDDVSKYMPSSVEENNNFTNIKLHKLGIYKEKMWENELEWRYLVSLIPKCIMDNSIAQYDFKKQIDIVGELNPNSIYLDLKKIKC